MSDSFQSTVDIGVIADPDARRALRAIQQEYTAALSRQQAEIDAILEVLLEKHVTSVGELRRHVTRLQQQQAHGSRAGRLHESSPVGRTRRTRPAFPAGVCGALVGARRTERRFRGRRSRQARGCALA